MRYLLLGGLVALMAWGCAENKKDDAVKDTGNVPAEGPLVTLLSPDESVRLTVDLRDMASEAGYPQGAQIYYKVETGAPSAYVEVIPFSPMGLVRLDQNFTSEMVFESVTAERVIDETYNMLVGKRSSCRSFAKEKTISYKNASGSPFEIVIRAYDEGIAFRYVMPGEGATAYTVTEESTGFRIPAGSSGWMQPYDDPSQDSPAYESAWENSIPVGTASSTLAGWALPALFKTATNQWILLAETDVGDSYCGSHLRAEAPSNVYRIGFPSAGEAEEIGAAEPSATLPWTLPWRIVVIGDTLAPIIETTLPTDLATPSVVADTSWIRPGRVSWHWWSEEEMDYNLLTPFIDLAAEMGWEYNLIDAHWHEIVNGTWQDLIAYATPLNVDLILWYNGGGPHNDESWPDATPRDRMDDPAIRKAEMQTIRDAGIKGVKIDFFQSDKQWMMQYYLDLLEDAAAYQLLVDFHGSTVPRGWQRTYPNLMTSEAVKGAEFYKWEAEYAANQAWRNTILPFTRNTVASMDFTPVTFTNNAQDHVTTYAHELALSVIFESGLFHFADAVEGYTALPEGPKNFLKLVPVAWDDTKFIEGEPGKWVVLARRKGSTWYAAGISGEATARTVALNLAFLGAGNYIMSLNADGATAVEFGETTAPVTAASVQNITLLPNGGFAARFEPSAR